MAALCVFVLLFVFLFRFGKSHGTRQPCLCVVVLAFDSLFQKMEDCSNEQHIPCVVPLSLFVMPWLLSVVAVEGHVGLSPTWMELDLFPSTDKQNAYSSPPHLYLSWMNPTNVHCSVHSMSVVQKVVVAVDLVARLSIFFFVYCNLLRKDSPPRPSIHPSIHACMCIVSVLSLSVC